MSLTEDLDLSLTEDQELIMRALINKTGARMVGTHLNMPVIRDRHGNFFAITPNGDTLRVIQRSKEE